MIIHSDSNNKEAINQFLNFLKEHGALKEYRKEVYNHINDHYHGTLGLNLYEKMNPILAVKRKVEGKWESILSCEKLIDYAFPWNKTKKGWEYWFNLNDLWIERVKKMRFYNLVI